MKWILTILACLFLISGCASIPLGTAMKFSSFDETDFAGLEPNDIRVKVIVDSRVIIKPSADTLDISVDSVKSPKQYSFTLEPIEYRTLAQESGLFSDKPARNQTLLRLGSDSIAEFRVFQKEMQKNGFKPKHINVSFNLDFGDNKPDTVRVSVLLKLTSGNEYITLIDNYELNLNNET